MEMLVLDYEKEIVELINLYLRNKYTVIKAYDGINTLNKINENKIDLAIVDIMVSNMDRHRLIENIRKSKEVLIIIL